MSGGSRDDYSGGYGGYKSHFRPDPKPVYRDDDDEDVRRWRREDAERERRKLEEDRKREEAKRAKRLEERRREIEAGKEAARKQRDTRQVLDRSMVRKAITEPSPEVSRVHVVLVDNSGSNREIAEHMKRSSGYLLATLGAVDPGSEIAFIYFSDHCDGDLIMQEVDYVGDSERGDKILHSTIAYTLPADGGDAPEAIECAMWRACDINFGSAEERYLYLVTDVLAHGMGMRGDNGCPLRRDWRDSVRRVGGTYGRLTVVGTGDNSGIGERQRQFIADESRVGLDHIDLSSVSSDSHRRNLTVNALLFLIARERGIQTTQAFLMGLYEKWLSDPIFGQATDLNAREAIKRFLKYMVLSEEEYDQMLQKVFGD